MAADEANETSASELLQSEESIKEKSIFCPLLRVSRWSVAKVRAKKKVIDAVEMLSKKKVPERNLRDDGKPSVLVGPVIGLVTTTTARILLEIDSKAKIAVVLETEPAVLQRSSMSSRNSNGPFQQLLRSSGPDTLRTSLSQPELEIKALQVVQHPALKNEKGLSNSSMHRVFSDSTILGGSELKANNTCPTLRKSSGSLWRWKGPNLSTKRYISKAIMRNPSTPESTIAIPKTEENDNIREEKELDANQPCVFEFRGLQPGTNYRVKLEGCREAVQRSSFRTFSEEPSECLRMAAISCNSIFITKKTITNISDLWLHLFKLIKQERIDLIVHLGDQIYGDGDKNLDAGAGKNRDKWSNRFKIALDILKDVPKEQWDSKRGEICEKYREVYRETWKHPPTANCLANCPNLMIYDDHEIRDNWGDIRSDWIRDKTSFFVAQCAWIVTMEYQRQLYEDVDFSNFKAIDKDYHFHVIGKVGLMFLDIRGSRTFHRVKDDPKPYLGTTQWNAMKEALKDGLFKEVQALVVCSPAPLVFLIPSITTALGKTVSRLQDFKGHWSHHEEEQMEMIDLLNKWKSSRKSREVIVLGGDVHCGGHSSIMKSGETLFYQLTTSAIANMPLPKSAYYLMRLAEQLEHIRGDIRFHHFGWTRARNYGLIQVRLSVKNEKPEIITQLIKGKFLRPVRPGEQVSSLQKDPYPTHAILASISPLKRRLINMILKACHVSSYADNIQA